MAEMNKPYQALHTLASYYFNACMDGLLSIPTEYRRRGPKGQRAQMDPTFQMPLQVTQKDQKEMQNEHNDMKNNYKGMMKSKKGHPTTTKRQSPTTVEEDSKSPKNR